MTTRAPWVVDRIAFVTSVTPMTGAAGPGKRGDGNREWYLHANRHRSVPTFEPPRPLAWSLVRFRSGFRLVGDCLGLSASMAAVDQGSKSHTSESEHYDTTALDPGQPSPPGRGSWWVAVGGTSGLTALVVQDHNVVWPIPAGFAAFLIHNVLISWINRRPGNRRKDSR
jgi:hypothetical protein